MAVPGNTYSRKTSAPSMLRSQSQQTVAIAIFEVPNMRFASGSAWQAKYAQRISSAQ